MMTPEWPHPKHGPADSGGLGLADLHGHRFDVFPLRYCRRGLIAHSAPSPFLKAGPLCRRSRFLTWLG